MWCPSKILDTYQTMFADWKGIVPNNNAQSIIIAANIQYIEAGRYIWNLNVFGRAVNQTPILGAPLKYAPGIVTMWNKIRNFACIL